MIGHSENSRQRKMLWDTVDQEMIETQRYTGRKTLKVEVKKALLAVDRAIFIPEQYRLMAWQNHPVSIGCEQTISQPYIVALMTDLLDLKKTDRVLEIGTGSGYQTAILAELAGDVYTVERIETLGEQAATKIESLGYSNVKFLVADGYKGWIENAPYNAIIITAAPDEIPENLVSQLAGGGRIVLPVGHFLGGQNLIRGVMSEGKLSTHNVLPVSFVPMLPETN